MRASGVTVTVASVLRLRPASAGTERTAGEVSRPRASSLRTGCGAGARRPRGADRSHACGASGPTYQFQIVLALSAPGAERTGPGGTGSASRPPERRPGWVRADAVEVRPVTNRIVVRLGARRLEVRRVRDGRLLLRSVAAVGAPAQRHRAVGLSTSSRRSSRQIRSTARSRSRRARSPASPTGPTTASSGSTARTCPALLGQAVSHGCVRVSNDVATRLRRLAPLGTPIDIVP